MFSQFLQNQAENGASIYFDKEIYIEENCEFINNSAKYGSKNASYPLKLKFSPTTSKEFSSNGHLSNISSGLRLPLSIEIEVCDRYYQKINTLNTGFIAVDLINNENLTNKTNQTNYFYKVSGITSQTITNGSAIFDFLEIFTFPVNKTLILTFSTSLIDNKIIDLNENSNESLSNPYKLTLPIEINACKLGEIYDEEGGFCSECPPNSYSFNIEISKCEECFLTADCYGGINISLHAGYWRSSIYSDKIHVCEPNKASCL